MGKFRNSSFRRITESMGRGGRPRVFRQNQDFQDWRDFQDFDFRLNPRFWGEARAGRILKIL